MMHSTMTTISKKDKKNIHYVFGENGINGLEIECPKKEIIENFTK